MTYPYPISRLLNLGDPRGQSGWPVYGTLGLAAEHVPDLIRMATDDSLNVAGSESHEVWAPLHAWRALGELRAEAAVEPLLTLLHRIDDTHDDWVGEELPQVYGMIGPAAIPALAAYLADPAHGLYARIATAHSLEQIGQRHVSAHGACVTALTGQLERFAENDPTLNGFLVSYLLDLKAVESAPGIERAFAAGRVDISVAGDWEDVQVEFGLKSARETPRPDYALEGMRGSMPEGFVEAITQLRRSIRKAEKKAEAKRKQAAKSRKKNRKKRR